MCVRTLLVGCPGSRIYPAGSKLAQETSTGLEGNPNHHTALRFSQEYQDVFSEGLGTIEGFQAKLHVPKEARPKFWKPRPVPFAMRETVEEELDRLEREGVIEKVDSVLDVDKYPLPRPEEIFATLAGGKTFTTLDLRHAYNQLVLDEESREFVTINTHRGLYRYKRLPYAALLLHQLYFSASWTLFYRIVRELLWIISSSLVQPTMPTCKTYVRFWNVFVSTEFTSIWRSVSSCKVRWSIWVIELIVRVSMQPIANWKRLHRPLPLKMYLIYVLFWGY